MDSKEIITDLIYSASRVSRTEADMFCITKKLDIHLCIFCREHLNLSISKNELTIWANFRLPPWSRSKAYVAKCNHAKRFYDAVKYGTMKTKDQNDLEHFDTHPYFRDNKSLMDSGWAEYKLELDLADPNSIEIATDILERLEKHNSYFLATRKAAILFIWIIMGLMIITSLLY
jgi:hypothetical protein